MRRKIIWTLLLLTGAAGSLVSCETTSCCGGYHINEFAYRNSTDFPVEIVGYTHPYSYNPAAPEIIIETWSVESGKILEFRETLGETGVPVRMPVSCDSVQLLLDNRRVLVYRRLFDESGYVMGEGIHDIRNYAKDSPEKHITHFTYVITSAQYDAATPIAGAEQ